ncbi:phospholipase D-like domain-containing protein [Halapricum hydrolyticum]|uniref:Phospholipase D-like domain-containing protein n=1 Tax=Halapricum hydrolyticum TaxID=2979991 RepID=A0AAE3LF31_9EURY|nr:phospholipase D-like domain-containing protein [Halapricum hydrolyticum]MCU4726870.1 phospholipase D-like domain-containing protein [Halapricum hydrolyticum]
MFRASGVVLLVVTLAIAAGLVSVAVATPDQGPGAVDNTTAPEITATDNTTAPEITATDNTTAPEITAVYPNPIAHGDEGEYLVLTVPSVTDLGTYRLADEHREARLPDRRAAARVVLTGNRSAVPEEVQGPIVEWPRMVPLANAGDALTLSGANGTVDTITYENAPEGEILRPDSDRRWRPLGSTAFEPVVGESGSVRAFALPDSPGVPIDVLDSADRRILLAGYTFTSERVAEQLIAARERGVAVEVLVDGAPVGGLTNRSAAVLDRLIAANVTVRVLGGGGRYRFHHPKYAVVDDRAIVLTENWKPAGVGGASSRGWGAVVDSPAVVSGLSRTFRADSRGHDVTSWAQFREDVSTEPAAPSRGRYPARIESRSVAVERTELLVAPDNAADRVQQLLADATDSIRIIQVSIGGRDDPLLQEAIAAAERGVEVEILLSSAWYTEEENRGLVQYLGTVAEREDLRLSTRLADPSGRYEKVHAKGVVIDSDTVVLGSLNWNAVHRLLYHQSNYCVWSRLETTRTATKNSTNMRWEPSRNKTRMGSIVFRRNRTAKICDCMLIPLLTA